MASSPDSAPPPDTDDTSPPSPPTPTTPPSNNSSSSSAPPPDDSSSSTQPPNPSPPPPAKSPPPPTRDAPPPSDDDSTPASPPPTTKSPPSSNPPPSPPPPSDDDDGSSSSPPPPPPPTDQQATPSPPPPPRHRTPTHSGALPPPQSESRDGSGPPARNESDVNVPLVLGVTAGVGVFLILMAIVFLCCNKKKKRNHHESLNYYTDPSRNGHHMNKVGGVDYYSNGPPQSWGQAPPSMDHMVKVQAPPGWHAPPPPPMMTSSDMSSAYSGPHAPPLPPPSPNLALGFNKSTFTYDELATATNGFSKVNLLGQGGFGYVHKGVLPNGKEIAVKSLKSGSGQGEREFQAEVEIISRVHHRHLVSLVGYCIAGGQRMLVYEFVANNNLEFHLHGSDRPIMDFPTRLKISLGSAKGLAYLHEDCHPRIIHRDIKAANILLDFNFEAMVADFGLAKLSSDNNTHVSTRVMGTFGYLAPEYASSGKLTEKSDVFSFGIMLLELITGRRPVDNTHTMMEDSLVDWARPLLTRALTDGNFDELVDERLGNNYSPVEMSRLVACAAASVRHSARRRPKMSQIVRALEGDSSLDDLNDGIKPGRSSAFSSSGSENESVSYHSQMRKLQMVALASGEFASSEYGATGEYGQQSSSSSAGENSASWDTKGRGNNRQRH